tara:strand:+ start:1316 stop:1579 length:264 start_codon:yes stop_codon:yes gene_type:complete
MKNILDWFSDDDGDVVVKSLNSKGVSQETLRITVGDIRKGSITDSKGYENEVVLFLRKNKVDRPPYKPSKRQVVEESDTYRIVRIEK